MIQKQSRKSKTSRQKPFSLMENSLLSIKDLKNSTPKKYNESLNLEEMYETSIKLSKNFESIKENLVLSNLSSKKSEKSQIEIFDNWITDNAKKVKSPFDSCEENNNFWKINSKSKNLHSNSYLNNNDNNKISDVEESDCVNMDINNLNSDISNKFDSNLFYDKKNESSSKNDNFFYEKLYSEESEKNNIINPRDKKKKERKSVMIMKDHILKTKSSLNFEKKRYKSENRSKREFSKDRNNFSKITHKIQFNKSNNKSLLFKNLGSSFISKEEDLELNRKSKLKKNLKPEKRPLSPLKLSDINLSKNIIKKRNSKFSTKTADRLIQKGLEYSKKRQNKLNKKLKEELKKCTFKPKTNFYKNQKDLCKTEIFFKIKSQNFKEKSKKNFSPNQKIKKTSLSPNTPKTNTFNIYNTSLLSTKNNISYFKTEKKIKKQNINNVFKKNRNKNKKVNRKNKIKNNSDIKIELLKEIHEVLSYLGFIDKSKIINVGNVELNKKDMIKVLIRLNFLPNFYEDEKRNDILSSEESTNEYSKLYKKKNNIFNTNNNLENDILIEEMWKLIKTKSKTDKICIKDLTLFILAIYGLSLNNEINGNFDKSKIREIENSFICFKKFKTFTESQLLSKNQNIENCKSLKMVEKNYRKTLKKAIFYKERGLLQNFDLEQISHSDFLDLKEKIKKIEINIKRIKENKKNIENCTFKPKINKIKKCQKSKIFKSSKNNLSKTTRRNSNNNLFKTKTNYFPKSSKNIFLKKNKNNLLKKSTKKTVLKIDIKISNYLSESIYLYPTDNINLKIDFLIKKHKLKNQQISKLKSFLKNQIKNIN